MARNFIDGSLFDDDGDALDLLGQAVRDAASFDKGIKREWDAIVLTQPIPMDPTALNFFLPSLQAAARSYTDKVVEDGFGSATLDALSELADDLRDDTQSDRLAAAEAALLDLIGKDKVVHYTFLARMTGADSRHQFVPNPCRPEDIEDEEDRRKIALSSLDYHTIVRASGIENIPTIGDIVQIRLDIHGGDIDIKNAEMLTTRSSNKYAKVASQLADLQRKECRKQLSSLFDDYSGETVASASGVSATGASATPEAVALQQGYFVLQSQAGKAKVSKQEVYNRLYNRLGSLPDNNNLIMGMMANINDESVYDKNVVSTGVGESSIGLFQMNVGRPGRFGTPKSNMAGLLTSKGAPLAMSIKKESKHVPYYAGALLVRSKGLRIITPKLYSGEPTDLAQIYNTLTTWENQIDFVADTTKALLADRVEIKAISSYSRYNWAIWFQVYFEQPASLHDRRGWPSAAEVTLRGE